MQTAIYWILIIIPALIVPFIAVAYRARLNLKRTDIRTLLDQGNINQYYLQARHIRFDQTISSEKIVRDLFDPLYSPSLYWFPLSMCFLLVFVGDIVAMARTGLDLGVTEEFEQLLQKTPWAVLAGFAGGYLWSLNDVLHRYRSIDLPPSSLNAVWLRIAIASVAGPLIATILRDQFAVLVAFGVGAFPVRTLSDFLRSVARKRLEFTTEPVPAEAPNLHQLQGLSAEVIARLEEEGITRAQHLANADPLKLSLITSIPWSVIVDIIDQAMLFNYVEGKIGELRAIGVRSAIEVANIHGCIDQGTEEERNMANAMVPEICRVLGNSESSVRYVIDTIAGDPQVKLLWELWRQLQRSA